MDLSFGFILVRADIGVGEFEHNGGKTGEASVPASAFFNR
jgi:hypothetical protein